MTPTATLETGSVLAGVRRARAEADAAEVQVLLGVVQWSRMHTVTDPEDAANWGGPELLLGGEGVPMVDEYCIAELATALGMSADAGRSLLAHAMEIAHRLPKIFTRVRAGELAV